MRNKKNLIVLNRLSWEKCNNMNKIKTVRNRPLTIENILRVTRGEVEGAMGEIGDVD